MARVSHPNVLAVHTFGEHEGIPYFVMEYVDGPTVEQWLEKHAKAARHRRGAAHPRPGVPRRRSDPCGERPCTAISKPSNLLIDSSLRVAVERSGRRAHPRGNGRRRPDVHRRQRRVHGARGRPRRRLEAGARDAARHLRARLHRVRAAHRPAAVRRADRHGPDGEAPPRAAAAGLEPPCRTCRPATTTCSFARSTRILTSAGAPSARSARARAPSRSGEEVPTASSSPTTTPTGARSSTMRSSPRFPDAQIDVGRDGEQAIAAFEENPYSVVLVDLQMPEVDGDEADRRTCARSTPRTRRRSS